MCGIRCCCRHSDGTLTGFIGHKSSLYALHKSCSEGTAEYSFRLESLSEDGIEEPRNPCEINDNEKNYRDDVNYGHYRNKHVCYLCDLLCTAEGNRTCGQNNCQKANPVYCMSSRQVFSADDACDLSHG